MDLNSTATKPAQPGSVSPSSSPNSSSDSSSAFFQKKTVVALLACFCCFLWGSAFPTIKIGYQMFHIASGDTGSQLLFAGCRFTLAGILVVLAGSLLQKKFLLPSKKTAPLVVQLSLVQTVLQYLFFYIGLAHASGITASIMEASNVFLAILVASCLFHLEPLGKQKLLGCLLGFLGVILINITGESLTFHMTFAGEGCILLSALSYAFSSVMIKRFSQQENPVTLSGYQFICGGVILAVIGACMGGQVTGFHLSSSLLLLYLSFISAMAYTLWGILLKYNPVGNVAIFGFMNPVCGVILSALLLGEQGAFQITTVIALVLVCAGIWVVNREKED